MATRILKSIIIVSVTLLLPLTGCSNTTITNTAVPTSNPTVTATIPLLSSVPSVTPTESTALTPKGTVIYDGTYTGTFNYQYREVRLEKIPGSSEDEREWIFGEWKAGSFGLTLTFGPADIQKDLSLDYRVFTAETLGFWMLGISNVSSTEPALNMGVLPEAGVAFLPPNATAPANSLYTIVIALPNHTELDITSNITVSADGRTLAPDLTQPPYYSSGYYSPAHISIMNEENWSDVYYREFNFGSWSLTRIDSFPKNDEDVLTGIYEDVEGEPENITEIKEELRKTTREELEQALAEIYSSNKDWNNLADIYYALRSQVRANQSIEEIPPEEYEGYEYLGRSIVKKSILWAESIQASVWADYPVEEMMSHIMGEMTSKNAMLEEDTIISDHYRKLN